jgi:hypothetical protein
LISEKQKKIEQKNEELKKTEERYKIKLEKLQEEYDG